MSRAGGPPVFSPVSGFFFHGQTVLASVAALVASNSRLSLQQAGHVFHILVGESLFD